MPSAELRSAVAASLALLAGWTAQADAGILSRTGPVIAILAGELYVGEAEGHLDGSGTISLRSQDAHGVLCQGQFTHSDKSGDSGNMRCSDGASATFQFRRLTLLRGYGTGTFSRGAMSFTYGLTAAESQSYLKLPVGKVLKVANNDLLLVEERLTAPASEVAPDVLLSNATTLVTGTLRQANNAKTSPEKIAELVESTILPLFDFRHMTQLAMARNWRLASPEQQNALVAEFRKLLIRTYSLALANYRDQLIEYKPLRLAPGETMTTVKSTVRQTGAERLSIDYDLEKTAAGWKVYDIKIADVSLITTYQSSFAQAVREGGVDGLIRSLASKNRQTASLT